MSEMEMMNEVETEEFTDELSDEALDRESEGGGNRYSKPGAVSRASAVPVTDR